MKMLCYGRSSREQCLHERGIAVPKWPKRSAPCSLHSSRARPWRLPADLTPAELRTFAASPSFDELLRRLAFGPAQPGADSRQAPVWIGLGPRTGSPFTARRDAPGASDCTGSRGAVIILTATRPRRQSLDPRQLRLSGSRAEMIRLHILVHQDCAKAWSPLEDHAAASKRF
jgi:hypothetical protein